MQRPVQERIAPEQSLGWKRPVSIPPTFHNRAEGGIGFVVPVAEQPQNPGAAQGLAKKADGLSLGGGEFDSDHHTFTGGGGSDFWD